MVKVTVVIPALNEAENLPHVLPRIPAGVHEVVLVDGHSTDGTADVARQLWPGVRVVQQQGRGKGAALRTGFAAATGDIIIMLDADGSTDPAEIPYFVAALLAGADFAKGSRFLHGGGTADMPFYRWLGNQGFVWMVRSMFGGRYTDLCYGYNAFWRHVLPYLNLDGDGFEIETMMNVRALRNGLRIVEVPSFEAKRVYGSSRLRTFPDGWRVVKTILREGSKHRTARPALTPLSEMLNGPLAGVHHAVMPVYAVTGAGMDGTMQTVSVAAMSHPALSVPAVPHFTALHEAMPALDGLATESVAPTFNGA